MESPRRANERDSGLPTAKFVVQYPQTEPGGSQEAVPEKQ